MRIEKEGFVLNMKGTWCEISNKYGVQEHGDVVSVTEIASKRSRVNFLHRQLVNTKIRD